MTKYGDLRGRRLRRHRRLLRRVLTRGVVWVRQEAEFRAVERLHRARLVTACPSKHNWIGVGRRPFRELAVFARETDARREYHSIMKRG